MAQTIALNIVLNGVPQAVNNIEELEIKLKQARLELSQIAIGSDAFKKLSKEISDAETKLKNLQKASEGKDLEGQLGDLARLGGAIGASFGAATAAFALFGEESESTTKALVQAQNALVIALAARELAEGAVVVKSIANRVATFAEAQAAVAANAATKSFYTTLAANPYAAIIAGIGLVVTALISFIDTTDEATDAQKEFNEELKKDTASEIAKFDQLKRTIENVSLSIGTRTKALEDLRAKFPAYFKDLKDEDILAGKVKVQYDALRDALIQTAQARALQNRIQKQQESLLEVEDKFIAAQKERIRLQNELKELQAQPGGQVIGGPGIMSGQVTARGGEEVILQNRLADARKEENRLLREKDGIQTKIKNDANRITKIQIETDKYTGDIVEKEKDVTKEKKEQVITNTQLLAQEQQRISELETLRAVLSFESVSEPTIIKDQEKILTDLESILSTLKTIAPEVEKEYRKIFAPDTKTFEDPFKAIIDNTGKFLENIKKLPLEFSDVAEVFEKLDLAGSLELFTPEQKQDITSYFNTVKKGADAIQKVLSETGSKEVVSQKEVADLFAEVIEERKKLTEQVKQGSINQAEAELIIERDLLKVIAKKFGINEEVLKGIKTSNEVQTKIFNDEVKRLTNAEELTVEIIKGVTALTTFGEEVDKQGEDIQKNNEKIKQQYEEIKKIVDSLNPKQVSELLQNLGFDFQKALTYVVTNAKDLGEETAEQFLRGAALIPIDFEKLTRKQLKNLQETLKIAIMDLEEYGIDAEAIFQKLFTDIEKSAKEKLIASIQDGIAQFQGVLNSLGQTTTAYFNQQFDLLEKRYKRITDSIVGDSEAANQKRLEAEKSYQAERARLEKQAAKTALRISLAQALANTAEAVTKLAAITGGVGAVIAGGALVAFNAVQVGIIANQLAQIDSYRRGGVLKMAGGGMLFGPSHEQGGIKFAQGGFELEGNESVINRTSTINYMGLLSQINQAGGGRPIGPGYDDSRIIEAIAKQRNTPIRAYVVESDITAKQETARRLEKLSQI